MMRIIPAAAAVAAALVLAACGSNAQGASVSMTSDACAVEPAVLNAGPVDFSVRNAGRDSMAFRVLEDGGEKEVGTVTVPPGQVDHLKVNFDHGDEYTTHCGKLAGREFRP